MDYESSPLDEQESPEELSVRNEKYSMRNEFSVSVARLVGKSLSSLQIKDNFRIDFNNTIR